MEDRWPGYAFSDISHESLKGLKILMGLCFERGECLAFGKVRVAMIMPIQNCNEINEKIFFLILIGHWSILKL